MHTQDDIIKDLEQPMISAKINGIKQAILLLLSGETLPRCAPTSLFVGCCPQVIAVGCSEIPPPLLFVFILCVLFVFCDASMSPVCELELALCRFIAKNNTRTLINRAFLSAFPVPNLLEEVAQVVFSIHAWFNIPLLSVSSLVRACV